MLFTPFFRNTLMTYLMCLEENVWIHFTQSLISIQTAGQLNPYLWWWVWKRTNMNLYMWHGDGKWLQTQLFSVPSILYTASLVWSCLYEQKLSNETRQLKISGFVACSSVCALLLTTFNPHIPLIFWLIMSLYTN